MIKFGTLLNSRPSAREDFLRMVQIINGSGEKEGVVLDFEGVEIMTPSYADELMSSLKQKYGQDKVSVENVKTMAVKDTLEAIQNEPRKV